MVRILLTLTLAVAQVATRSAWTADDESIVSTVVKTGELRVSVDRIAAAADLPVPAPMVLFDRTLNLCQPSVPPTRPMGCLLTEHLESFVGGRLPSGHEFFDGLLSAEVRRQLAGAFRERNREPVSTQGLALDNVIWTTPAALDATLKESAARARGYVSFSRPAYSAGWAFIEVRYSCGGMCGYSWYLLLAKRGESWAVLSTALLSIS
jgi:hypothetical protein